MKLLLTCAMLKKKENQNASILLLKDRRKGQCFFHYSQFEAEIIQEEKYKDENFNVKINYPEGR